MMLCLRPRFGKREIVAAMRCDERCACVAVIASEAKQSMPSQRKRHGLLRRFAPRKKQLVEWVSGRLRAWLQLDGEAEFFEARDQSACFELDWPAIEVG